MKFIDEVNITATSGHGGRGCISFRRETGVPRGGPDGGDGGKGGDVVFVANPRIHSLLDLRFKKVYCAKNGRPGEGQLRTGADGEDLLVEVPPGTIIKTKSGEILADLAAEERVIILKGGRGGKGNHFYKSSVNQAPEKAQSGEEGQTLDLHIELKLLADVGIIGFPNAGKSTFISKISAAKPKIADYPFTTLVPNLGVVKVEEGRNFVVADIPGLIQGAHQGVGLGSQFLKHIERTRVFVHLIDVSEFNPRNPWQDYLDIQNELEQYDKQKLNEPSFAPLAQRKQFVCLSKIDSTPGEKLAEIIEEFKDNGVKATPISAVSGEGIKSLVYEISREVFGND